MQYYRDSTGELYAFEDGVDVATKTGPAGNAVASIPDDLTAVAAPVPSAAERLARAQADQIRALRAGFSATINAGAISSALGAPYVYPVDAESRSDLQGAIVASLLHTADSSWTIAFASAPTDSPFDRANYPLNPHTAAQIQQAGDDIMAWYSAQKKQAKTLIAQVNAVTPDDSDPVATVQAIEWAEASP